MADLETRINETFQELAVDIAQSLARDGTLSTLTTQSKTNLVAAINEVKAIADSAPGSLQAANDLSDVADVATARTNLGVDSSVAIATAITTAIAGVTLAGLGGVDQAAVDASIANVVGAAPAALDTLAEIAAKMANDDNAFAALTATISNKVDYTVSQSLDAAQKLQACTNIGVGDPDFDFKAAYIATRDA